MFFTGEEVNVLNLEEWENEERRCKRYCCCCCRISTAYLYLCFSLMTMFIGLTLFIVSLQQQQQQHDEFLGPRDFGVDAMREYWMQLSDTLVPKSEVVIPGSPVYKTLQWMVVRDPLRPLKNEERIRQRYALSALYFSWSGTSWTLPEGSGWLKEATHNKTLVEECAWQGITCNQNGQVIGLELEDRLFALSGGRIPTQLAELTALQTLNLGHHGLEGSLPTELARLTNLVSLDLVSNRLTSLDLAFLSLGEVQVLSLTDNEIKGTLDFTHLEKASNLRILELNGNRELGGSIFSRMSKWKNLERVDFSSTNLEGSLPDDIGKLTNLKFVSLGADSFFSTLPTSIAQCTSLEQFNVITPALLEGAGLKGGLPTEIGRLTNLNVIDIRNNIHLGSTLPTELGGLTKLTQLSVETSGLQGTLATEIGNLEKLESMTLLDNHLTGTIPTEYGRLTNLYFVGFVSNDFSGTVPEAVCDIGIQQFTASCRLEARLKCDCCVCEL